MRWVEVVPAVFVLALAGLPACEPALADEKVPIKVRVDGKGHGDTTVTVRALGSTETRTAETDGRGRAEVAVAPGKTYEVTITSGDRKGTSYVTPAAGEPASAGFDTAALPKAATVDDANAQETLIAGMKAAAGACDRPAYDALKADYDRLQAGLEQSVRELDAVAEQYAEATGFPPDRGQLRQRVAAVNQLHGGAGGSVKQAQKAGLPVDPAIFQLLPYLDVVELRDRLRERLRAVQAARARIPEYPKECSRTAACPQGQSGGLLAGAVNSVFGTDLAGVCDEPQPQHRDTDRPSRDHGRDREHRD